MTELVLMGDPRVAAIPVNECGDELIDTRHLAGLESTPDENPHNRSYAFLRHSVARRLLQAQGALPPGLRLLLAEGYRPYEQQEFYFNCGEKLLRFWVNRVSDVASLLGEVAAEYVDAFLWLPSSVIV